MKRIPAAVALALGIAALPVVAGTASAETATVTCGTQWTQGTSGPDARDYQWGNCGTSATKIKVYSLTYGGAFKTLIGEKCVVADAVVPLGGTTDWRVLSYTGEDTGAGC
ncbi:hypothetical protein [Amycolatopsis sp. NPDC051371]|uniref:hypothetical protein n=1 Tax=Amycolatopsis sp. NPDC051371 TaxID=3155800 RepID=UPI003440F305